MPKSVNLNVARPQIRTRLARLGLEDSLEPDATLAVMLRRWVAIPETCSVTAILLRFSEDDHLTVQLREVFSRHKEAAKVKLVPDCGGHSQGFIRDPFIVGACLDPTGQGLRLCMVGDAADWEAHPVLKALQGMATPMDFGGGKAEGGNFMVTPGTEDCPQGLILVGDEASAHAPEHTALSLALQDSLRIDVSETHVSHTDERVAFVGGHGTQDWALAVPSQVLAATLLKAVLAKKDMPPGWLWCSRGFTVGANLVANNPKSTRDIRRFCEKKATQSLHASERQRHEAVSLDNAGEILERLGETRSERLLILPDLPGTHPSAINLLNVNGLVVVPRQHAYRVGLAAAVDILHATFQGTLNVNYDQCLAPLRRQEIEKDLTELLRRQPTLPFYVRPGESMRLQDAAKACTLSKDLEDPSVQEVLTALGVPLSDHGKMLVGPQVLQIPAQGTVDILEAFIFVSLRSLGLDCAFVDTSHLCKSGGNLHCATNRLPDLNALDWDVDEIGHEFLG
ncbi:hypothetical protein [Corallococcus llansteffanensis]|uniref:Protein-arginine deiminase C-terminal domain-containing protein n=1 Tax=Corallococcus llansteffanensis TaxID=2316731 RepID=A0A3A8R173_9BACT|nr:hypothetical protein [Corallococcus llansteffanensis]RKH69034.1 hypothetical protein D7V93_00505 [Corallococcus llansteffanensis]